MSDFHAIGGVGETLRALLLDRMDVPPELPPSPLRVSLGSPRSDVTNPLQAAETPRVNLFLYTVAENGALKNQEIPGRGTPGAYGHPPLSLDLHYLLTAYGSREVQANFQETLAHFLLGSAMRVFHDHAIITDDLLTVRDPVGTPILHDSLRGEFEHVKLALEPVNLEELSKLWTALTQPYRVSASYHVTVVQIESRRQKQFPRRVKALPPGGPVVHVVPFRYPQIQELAVRWQDDPSGADRPYPYARVGDTLILKGTNLGSPHTAVKIGGLEIRLGLTGNTRIEVPVPDDVLPDGSPVLPDRRLQPGPQTVEVRLGVPELPAAAVASNQAVFMLTPRIVPPAVANLAVTPRTLTLNGMRLFDAALRSETVVGRAVIPASAYTGATPTQITMPLPDTLTAFPVPAYVSGPGIAFPLVAPPPLNLDITIAGEGPRLVHLPRKPASVADAAELLQAALHISEMGGTEPGPAFRGARVTFTTDGRLVIVPGQLAGPVAVAINAVSQALNLTAATGAATVSAYLSGELVPFPVMHSATPRLLLTIGAVSHAIALPARPTEMAEVVAWLENAIRSFAGDPAFAGARVAALGNQILLIPGGVGTVRFDPVLPDDPSSVFELELARAVPVRVRVNGAETIAEVTVDLTP
jgi:hypothetical protein